MHDDIVIHWFRQDLRLMDNPALFAAARRGRVLPLYILDDIHAGDYRMGAASRWWLHHALQALNQSLDGRLVVRQGDPADVLTALIDAHQVRAIYWNRCYEPWRSKRDEHIEQMLKAQGVEAHIDSGSLLWEPRDILKSDDTPYKVFTPFYRKGCLAATPPREPLPSPPRLSLITVKESSTAIADLNLLPEVRWDTKLAPHWHIGEQGAHERLEAFLQQGLAGYKQGRDFPARANVSRLSPHLHWGELSPNQVWYAVGQSGDNDDVDRFASELAWREFSYYQLCHFPNLPEQNLNKKFDDFPWRHDPGMLSCWQSGQTGHPMVDAGMRELWQTGYMHNRVRMIVGSFLVKNLLLHWHHGERWFWDCLVDADLANNSASWQWVAGCGSDAAPYFRVFNPVLQGQKFDTAGEYTRRFVPELRQIPDKYLFNPWEAPASVLKAAGVVLGQDYPTPVVDLKSSRERALAAFASLKKARDN
jgi:deoxyribodipyrimidine photo-lyase